MTTIDNDGERMVPAIHAGSLLYAEHTTRYLAATALVEGRRVLDIACGSGYGTHLLSQSAEHVVGVDVSPVAVSYASQTYGAGNNEFVVGDATAIPLPDDCVDVVVSFETIEHVASYGAFVAEVDRVLAPDGLFVLSTPNDAEFIQDNHFHLHQFGHDELLGLVRPYFTHVEEYFQATWKSVVLAPASALASEGPIDTGVLNLAPLGLDQYLYFYMLCSRRPVTETISPILALGSHYSDRLMRDKDLAAAQTVALASTLRQELAEARAELADLRRRAGSPPTE
jgi:ubiquinone/menaquinone biosynthesis C-methylase UbiE